MDKTEIIAIVVAIAALGFSLYRKYIRKDQKQSGSGSASRHGSSISSPSGDDDYEPYSRK